MTITSHDPRNIIRQTLGTTGLSDEDETFYYLSVLNDVNDTVKIPLYLSEEIRSGVLPELPYISMRLLRVGYTPHDVGARVYDHKGIIDCLVMFADTDDIDRTLFGKRIIDELVSKIRTYQSSITNVMFLAIDSVRQIESAYGHQVIYPYIVEISTYWVDAC